MLTRTAVRVAFLVLFSAATADAAQRTFVSAGSGSDANPCTRALPCRSFGVAISQTDAGGEVVVLDSGGYGPVAITKSVAIIAPPGVHAAVTATAGSALDIAAGSTDVVIVRGLYLNNLGGTLGIYWASGQTLHVENCVISGFIVGILGNAEGSDVYVLDTVSRLNQGSGFQFESETSVIRASLDSVRAAENPGGGVVAGNNSLVTVTRSVAAGGQVGFGAYGSGVLNIESSTTTMNVFGVYADLGATVRVRNSMITGNPYGIDGEGSKISFGNNGLHGNGFDGSFSSTVAQQ